MVYIHPAKERNGRRVFVEGNYNPEETFLLIDDLVTSGGGILETAAFLKQNARADVRDVLVLLDREEGARALLKKEGYNLINILGMETMLNYLMAKGLIQEDQYKRSIDYVQTRRAQRAG
jgi:orotate phosphoribosyltransferase